MAPGHYGLSFQCSATELRQLNNHQPLQHSLCTARVVATEMSQLHTWQPVKHLILIRKTLGMGSPSLKPRLSILDLSHSFGEKADFFSQICETKSETESLGLRLEFSTDGDKP